MNDIRRAIAFAEGKEKEDYSIECLYESSCGAVVFRRIAGEIRYLLIKNKRSANWGFPKGHIENGETKEDAYKRAVQAIDGIKKRFRAEERVILFAHGTFNNYLINAAIGFPVRDDFNFCQENTGITCIKFLPDGRTKIEFSNDYCHLAPLGEIEY